MAVPYTFADTTLSGLNLNLANLDADFTYITDNIHPLTVGASINGGGQTSVTFSGIPSWARRITINFYGIAVSGTSQIRMQVGNASGFLTTAYYSTVTDGSLNSNTTVGFNLTTIGGGSNFNYGAVTLNYAQPAPFVSGVVFWVENSMISNTDVISKITNGTGGIAVSGDLTQIKIFTVNGTDTFSGVFGISYE